jgi:hypothetical protein
MKAQDLKDISELSGNVREMLLAMLAPALDERLTEQPVEACAVYLANLRWALYDSIESLSKLERMAEAAAPAFQTSTTVDLSAEIEELEGRSRG